MSKELNYYKIHMLLTAYGLMYRYNDIKGWFTGNKYTKVKLSDIKYSNNNILVTINNRNWTIKNIQQLNGVIA